MGRKWRILSIWKHSNFVGGSEVLTAEIARAMVFQQVDYHLACSTPYRTYRFFKSQGLHSFVMKPTRSGLLEFLKENRFDLVETCQENPWVGEIAHQVGVPFVWKLTTDPALLPWNPQQQTTLERLRGLADRIVILSHRFLSIFGRKARSKVYVIPAGIHLEPFRPVHCKRKRLEFRRRFGLLPNTIAVGMVANFYPRKRHFDFLRAAEWVLRHHPRIRFFLFGNAYSDRQFLLSQHYRLFVKQLIQELRLSRQITLHPFYPDRVGLASGLDIVALPSQGEGHPLALLDAMAAGTPVIGANSGGIPDLIEHGQTGYLVPPEQPKKLVDAIMDLIEHPERARSFSQAGKIKVAHGFDVRQQTQKYMAFYKGLLG